MEKAELTLDYGSELLPYSDVCNRCVHLTDGGARVCAAFPKGIPVAIWAGLGKHTRPFHGDHGIQFEAIGKPEEATT